MGKRLLVQRMGRGTPTFISPSWRRVAPLRYLPFSEDQLKATVKGIIKELLHVPGLNAPAMHVVLEDGREMYLPAVEGVYVGKIIEFGPDARIEPGNILPIGRIPEGTMICNIEKRAGDGGKFARSGGTYGVVMAHRDSTTVVQLPSGKTIEVDSRARATVGIVAGGGRVEKPFVKAGDKDHRAKAKAWKYPKVRGKAMSPYAHPHGGGSHPKGGTPVRRTAPPGQKVGFYGSKCTGRGCVRWRAQQAKAQQKA